MKCKDCKSARLVGYIDSNAKKLWCPAMFGYVNPESNCCFDAILEGFKQGFDDMLSMLNKKEN